MLKAKMETGADLHDYKEFDVPEKVTEKDFKEYKEMGRGFELTLPAGSVVEIRLAR